MSDTAFHAFEGEARKVDRLLAHYGESHRQPDQRADPRRGHPGHHGEHRRPAVRPAPLGGLRLRGGQHGLLPAAEGAGAAGGDGGLVGGRCSRWSTPWATQVLPISAGIFVVGWIFQFVGHKIEGKKPSFFEDIQYLWVGPLFVVAWLLRRLGIRW